MSSAESLLLGFFCTPDPIYASVRACSTSHDASIHIEKCLCKTFVLYVDGLILEIFLQLAGASPELIGKLIPEHARRHSDLSFLQMPGT